MSSHSGGWRRQWRQQRHLIIQRHLHPAPHWSGPYLGRAIQGLGTCRVPDVKQPGYSRCQTQPCDTTISFATSTAWCPGNCYLRGLHKILRPPVVHPWRGHHRYGPGGGSAGHHQWLGLGCRKSLYLPEKKRPAAETRRKYLMSAK